jgi:N-acetylneuraminic acid mutarotase
MKNKVTIAFFGFLWIFCAMVTATYSQSGSGTWSEASYTGFAPRYWFTSSAVNDKIYVIGGYESTGLSQTVDVYDPSTDTWDTLATTGTFTPRAALASAVVDGKIYVMGGVTGPESPQTMSSKLEVLDPSTNTWSTPVTTGTFTKRDDLCACVVNGKIYTIGGYDAATGDVNTFEMFDPSTNTWSTPVTTGTFTPDGALTAQVVNNKIYVLGGLNYPYLVTKVQMFDPSTNTWSTPATRGIFTARLLFTSGVIDGKIYVAGGTPDIQNPLTTNVLQVFDPSTNTWSTPASTGTFTPRMYLATSSGVVAGNLYVMGGQDGTYMYSTNEAYTPALADVKMGDATSLDIKLSPNPTDGLLTIYNAPVNTHVAMENILGETVMESGNSQTPSITLDLSKLSPGTYFARIVTPTSVITRKIVRG